MNSNNNKRNTIILTVLGAVTLLITIIGATFAYFTITGNSTTTPTTITGTTENTGSIALTNPNPSMHINLSSSDMSFDKKGTSYFATTEENKNYDITGINRNIAVATVTGGGEATKYECTANLTISVSGTMKEHLVNGDGKITLTPTTNVDLGEKLEFDLTSFTENKVLPVTYKITGPTTESIGLQMQINNTEAPQDDIAGKEISITVTNSNFNCETVEEFTPKSGALNLLAQKPANLNQNLEGGLYRYQGTASAVTNNYICFGTSDKDTCTSDTDKYMYRIIGINESGQFKLIKKEALNTRYYFHSSSNDTVWKDSDLYKGLNGISGGNYSNLFIGNTTYIPNDTWKNKIADTTWKYGDNTSVTKTASALYNVENGWSTTVNAKIGLMYAHDYTYALQSGGNICNDSSTGATCKTNWLFLWNSGNDSNPPSTSLEWTMSRYGHNGSYYDAWAVRSNGGLTDPFLTDMYSVRPVFFLEANTLISGEGTLTSPYVITN